jgi:hypothetical protein
VAVFTEVNSGVPDPDYYIQLLKQFAGEESPGPLVILACCMATRARAVPLRA